MGGVFSDALPIQTSPIQTASGGLPQRRQRTAQRQRAAHKRLLCVRGFALSGGVRLFDGERISRSGPIPLELDYFEQPGNGVSQV